MPSTGLSEDIEYSNKDGSATAAATLAGTANPLDCNMVRGPS